MNRPDSTAKNMQKFAELKLSSCKLEVADFRNNCDCGIAVAEQHFFKSCGIAIAEVLPSNCGVAIADSKKVVRAHLWYLVFGIYLISPLSDKFGLFNSVPNIAASGKLDISYVW